MQTGKSRQKHPTKGKFQDRSGALPEFMNASGIQHNTKLDIKTGKITQSRQGMHDVCELDICFNAICMWT